ncbi:hypothetical protein V8E51_009689 [Hyaloscypha variabilis]
MNTSTIQATSSTSQIVTLPTGTSSQTHLSSSSGTSVPTPLATKPGLSTGAKAGVAIAAIEINKSPWSRRASTFRSRTANSIQYAREGWAKHRAQSVGEAREKHKVSPAGEVVLELPVESTHHTLGNGFSDLTTGRSSELDASSPQTENAQRTFGQPYEPSHDLEIFARDKESAADADITSEPESEPADFPSHTLLSDVSGRESGSSVRMEELRAKRDKIKAEKGRLLKLQELDEMEATVQREMLEEQRKSSR